MENEESKELQRLVSMYIDGGASESDLAALNEMLGDDEARKAYLELVTVHTDLMSLRPVSARTDNSDAIDKFTNEFTEGANRKNPLVGRATQVAWLRYGSVWIAASLLAILAYHHLLLDRTIDPSESEVAIAPVLQDVKQDTSVARIIRKVDCDWEGDRWTVESISRLQPGQSISLARGLMELEFNSGASVTLEAPVSFTVDSAMLGTLSRGKLTAHVPDRAKGFTVRTPNTETVDLGTKFGLVVGNDGATETHVFSGEVIVHPTKNDANELRLTDDMAVRLVGEKDATHLAAVPGRFTRLGFDNDALASVPTIDRKLSLWISADRRVQRDEKGRVSAWGDLRSKSNVTTQDAWQVTQAKRPLWVEDAIHGQPAIRFGAGTVMTTEPLELGSAQSIVVVFRINIATMEKWGVGREGRQLINMNGPPHLSLKISPRRRLHSQNYRGFRVNEQGEREYLAVGITKSPWEIDQQPIVAVTIYDPSINSSRLYINGELVGEAEAPELDSTTSPRYIGSHPFIPGTHFFGDLAELMIYDAGLSDAEATKLSMSLMSKYGIQGEREKD